MNTMRRIDPRKTVGMGGMPEDITKILVKQQPRQLLDLLNKINRSGQILAV
jgi:hypothetical protein